MIPRLSLPGLQSLAAVSLNDVRLLMASLHESDDARSELDSDDDHDLGMDHVEDDLATSMAYSWRIDHSTGDHRLNRMVPSVLSLITNGLQHRNSSRRRTTPILALPRL
jgi:hypothetical protein